MFSDIYATFISIVKYLENGIWNVIATVVPTFKGFWTFSPIFPFRTP